MFGLGKVTCVLCGNQVRRREARRGQDAVGACACDGCYASWEKTGRRCPACETPVRGMQDVGLLAEAKSFGHADCGGARVLRA
jgi:hypothetical protein